MPKTSIAKKTRDSKHKKGYKGRAKGRQEKKNKQMTQMQNMYVDKLAQLKEERKKMEEKNQKIKDEEESQEEEGEVEMSEEDNRSEQSQTSQVSEDELMDEPEDQHQEFDIASFLTVDELATAQSTASEATVQTLKKMTEQIKE